MTFADVLEQSALPLLTAHLPETTEAQVERALGASELTLTDFIALLSPAAGRYLEPMAHRARDITLRRFGRIIQLYAPLYVSNDCVNRCAYCSFSVAHALPRITLPVQDAIGEARAIRRMGFQHLLVVAGESRKSVPPEYFESLLRAMRDSAACITLEIYPLETSEYARLVDAGADGVTLYQETYDPVTYKQVHPAGPKADYRRRLAALDRAGEAGMARLNVGALLGLHADWRAEAAAVGLHASWLTRKYWRSLISVSFPRLRKGPDGYQPPHPVDDRALVQMMLAIRMFLPDAGLVLSTREPQALRDALIPLGITQMSAGSRTEPRGYTVPCEEGAQFDVQDRRTPSEVADVIRAAGYEPVWKDWDKALSRGAAA